MNSSFKLDEERAHRLRGAIATTDYVTCSQFQSSTYDFYHYPARFPQGVARTVIEEFSKRGDWVMDPFMGGGTSIVEGLLLKRKMFGADINALAHFVTSVRTQPISSADEDALRRWATDVSAKIVEPDQSWIELAADRKAVRNLPRPVETFMAGALQIALDHQLIRRQHRFARAVLLRLGQWSLESRDNAQPRRKRLAQQLPVIMERMFKGLRSFVEQCADIGISKNSITRWRVLMNRSAMGLAWDDKAKKLGSQVKLAFTSPPYPSVNVLYHRWQHRGRRETPAPYWIANVPDGYGQAYYTGGSRTPTGLTNYFAMITSAFSSVAELLAPGGHAVQLVGFSDAEHQLPAYLDCMRRAGLQECEVVGGRLDRRVVNRRWYAKLQGDTIDTAMEYMLIHRRPC